MTTLVDTSHPLRLSSEALGFAQPLHRIEAKIDPAALPALSEREMFVARLLSPEQGYAVLIWDPKMSLSLALASRIPDMELRFALVRKNMEVLEPELKAPFALDRRGAAEWLKDTSVQTEPFDMDRVALEILAKGEAVVFGSKCPSCSEVHNYTACYSIAAAAITWAQMQRGLFDWWVISGTKPQDLPIISPFTLKGEGSLEVIRTITKDELGFLTLGEDEMVALWVGVVPIHFACLTSEAVAEVVQQHGKSGTIEWNIGGRVPERFLEDPAQRSDVFLVLG